MSNDRAFKLAAIRNEVYVHTSHWDDAQDQLTEAMDLFRWARPFIPAEAGELKDRITRWMEVWLECRGYRSRVSIPSHEATLSGLAFDPHATVGFTPEQSAAVGAIQTEADDKHG